ncbi:hypothetical protein KFE25_003268 [Diacronema lutheri]|uniref:3-hydroxyanthranilate 3,4-dioxygenase n=2 Tax=Diacronema lutheri TaxID=2081491 RepID=A0A8J5XJ00_DIALT|nr:hypothetical protein KFE25_003268 [Diacronema lutheri]
MPHLAPLNLEAWISEHRHELVPPVCNKLVFGDGSWKVMVVGGPNERADYHIEEGEEFFFQLKGAMCLKLIEQGRPRDVTIGEGQMFLLPARIPHSPNRVANSVGLVVERARREGELDGLRYYTAGHAAVLYEEWFHCTDLGKDLKPIIERFNASDAKRTGVPERAFPPPPVRVDESRCVPEPIAFDGWLARERGAEGAPEVCAGRALFPHAQRGEFAVDVYRGACATPRRARAAEVLLLQREGSARVQVEAGGEHGEEASTLILRAGELVLLPAGCVYAMSGVSADCAGIELYLDEGFEKRPSRC